MIKKKDIQLVLFKRKIFSFRLLMLVFTLSALLFLMPFISFGNSFQEIKKETGNIKSIKAQFIQEKHMKILKRPLISKGVFLFQNPGSLRWEYISPIKSILLIHNGNTKRYSNKNGVITKDSGISLEAMQFVMQEITGWLSGNFDNNPLFNATLKQGKTIVLIPKNKSFSKMIEKIEISFSKKPGVIDFVMIYESKDSYTKLKFINQVINEKLEDALFNHI